MSDSYYSMYGDPSQDRQDEGVLSDMIPYVAKPAQSPSSAVIPRMALGQNPPVSSQTQMAPPASPPPQQQQQSSGDIGGLSSLLGSLGGMGGSGGGMSGFGGFGGMGGMTDDGSGMGGMGGMGGLSGLGSSSTSSDGDVSGYGSAPFISNKDSDNVFDSAGNIAKDGGDTSDWADIAYTAAKLYFGFANGGYVSEPEAFAQGGLVPLAGGGKIAIGPGGGLDDLIPTTIGGRRAAALSDGEFVFPADVVSMMGDGSSNAGARRLYDLVKQIRGAKTGTDVQAKPLPVGDILKRTLG